VVLSTGAQAWSLIHVSTTHQQFDGFGRKPKFLKLGCLLGIERYAWQCKLTIAQQRVLILVLLILVVLILVY
jgi:hypothetical protein